MKAIVWLFNLYRILALYFRHLLSQYLVILTFLFVIFFQKSAMAQENSFNGFTTYEVLENTDQIPSRWTNIRRVVAIGDIHGDLNALLKILKKKGLIDAEGHWIGGDTHLVMMGDLINGGEYSRSILDYLMRLELEANFSGGKVHVILGNHEIKLLFGDIYSMSQRLLKALLPPYFKNKDFNREQLITRVKKDFMSPYGKYNQWLQSKNAIVVINNIVFVHAGLRPEWFKGKDSTYIIEQINSTVRYLIKNANQLDFVDKDLLWTVGLKWDSQLQKFTFLRDLGPMWDRSFGTREIYGVGVNIKPNFSHSVPVSEFKALLKFLGVQKQVIGHNPVRSSLIRLEHPYWGSLVTAIDTRISKALGGELSAFEMNRGDFDSLQFNAENFNRPKKENRLNRVLNTMKGSLNYTTKPMTNTRTIHMSCENILN
jgi:hypothetical protein